MSQSVRPSRPSITNCADGTDGDDRDAPADSLTREEETIPPILASFREQFPELVNMAISMVPGDRLRRECTREIRGGDGSVKSRLMQGVLREFLNWYIEQERSQLVFESPEGEEVTAPVPNSYSEEYGREHYGRIKDIERAAVKESYLLHTVMLSLTASSIDENGQHRPLGEHLQGIQDSWSPYVRRELQRTLERAGFERYNRKVDYEKANAIGYVLDDEVAAAKWWEYVTVIEPHPGGDDGAGDATGYGHFHVGVFASHPVDEEMFHSVIEKHLEKCEHAGRAAHDLGADDPEERPISLNEVDPETEAEGEEIGNLGSYLSEYIGGFSGDLDERPIYELVFQAVCWAQGRQRVRYSRGANKLSSEGRAIRAENGETVIPVSEPGWSVAAIEDAESGERYPPATGGADYMVSIRDGPPPGPSGGLDPPPEG